MKPPKSISSSSSYTRGVNIANHQTVHSRSFIHRFTHRLWTLLALAGLDCCRMKYSHHSFDSFRYTLRFAQCLPFPFCSICYLVLVSEETKHLEFGLSIWRFFFSIARSRWGDESKKMSWRDCVSLSIPLCLSVFQLFRHWLGDEMQTRQNLHLIGKSFNPKCTCGYLYIYDVGRSDQKFNLLL